MSGDARLEMRNEEEIPGASGGVLENTPD